MLEIPLSKGYKTIIDDIDSDLAKYNWWSRIHQGGRYVYARRWSKTVNGKRRPIVLHRVILERKLGHPIPEGMDTDHADGNTLNNRRGNLRLASRGQNTANSVRKTTIGGRKIKAPYRGVYRAGNKWMAQVRADGDLHYLGTFDTARQAARAYNSKALEMFGRFAMLNEGVE